MVHLVTRDVVDGIAKGDTAAELFTRLRRLPTDLDGENGLYALMLKRNTSDLESYRNDTAVYLSMACTATPSILNYYLATNLDMVRKYLLFEHEWETLHSNFDCERLVKAIPARTGGLLETTTTQDRLARRAARTRDSSLTTVLNHFGRRRVDFTHRTARTWLLESKVGRKVLKDFRESCSEIDRICFRTRLVTDVMLSSFESLAPRASPGQMFFPRYKLDLNSYNSTRPWLQHSPQTGTRGRYHSPIR